MKTLIIGGMHGNEPLGIDLVRLLKTQPIEDMDTYIANPRAVKLDKRFVEQDLNRVFPGKPDGDYEERRAVAVLAKTTSYDLVLDFHNTQANQPSCGFVGLEYDARLLDMAGQLGMKYVIEASYDCINKYAPNCLSVEICMRDSHPDAWMKKLRQLGGRPAKRPQLYRYMRRVTWEEADQLGVRSWRPFQEIPAADKQKLSMPGSACPIFIGSKLTPYFATLVERIDTSDTIKPKEETMALSTQPYKGARDFYPEDKRVQNYLFRKIEETCKRFGYEEYNAPILEPTELYLSKGNQEIIDEQTYTFQDRGGRSVTIRTEMTPTVSRLVAGRRQELAYPIRWFSWANFWRYERAQKGRLREFWQLNIDIFGVETILAEQELILFTVALFKSFGAKPSMYVIKLNNRQFINYLMSTYLGLDEVQTVSMIRLIDRYKKMERADFVAQADAICQPSQREAGVVERLLDVLAVQQIEQLPQALQDQPNLLELKSLIGMVKEAGVTNVEFDVTLMRGFDYYTDTIIEVNDTDPENSRSLLGGGRYNGLVGSFGVEPVPTAGYALGDVTFEAFLRGHDLLPDLLTETDVYVVFAGDVVQQAQKAISELRKQGVNVAVDFSGRKLDKQLATAVKKGIRYALIVGEQELADEQFTLRDLSNGTEEKRSLERIVSIIEDYRRPAEAIDSDFLYKK